MESYGGLNALRFVEVSLLTVAQMSPVPVKTDGSGRYENAAASAERRELVHQVQSRDDPNGRSSSLHFAGAGKADADKDDRPDAEQIQR
jgi:hypothetical protein